MWVVIVKACVPSLWLLLNSEVTWSLTPHSECSTRGLAALSLSSFGQIVASKSHETPKALRWSNGYLFLFSTSSGLSLKKKHLEKKEEAHTWALHFNELKHMKASVQGKAKKQVLQVIPHLQKKKKSLFSV